MNIKSTPEERQIDQEIKMFVKFLNQDDNIQEVNYNLNEVTYRIGKAMISVTFKAKK